MLHAIKLASFVMEINSGTSAIAAVYLNGTVVAINQSSVRLHLSFTGGGCTAIGTEFSMHSALMTRLPRVSKEGLLKPNQDNIFAHSLALIAGAHIERGLVYKVGSSFERCEAKFFRH